MFGYSKASDSFPKVSCKSPDPLAAVPAAASVCLPAGERSFWHGYEQEETINRQADMPARMPGGGGGILLALMAPWRDGRQSPAL